MTFACHVAIAAHVIARLNNVSPPFCPIFMYVPNAVVLLLQRSQLPPPALDLCPMFVRGLLASVEVRNVPDPAGYPHHLVVAGPLRGQAHLRVGPNLRAVSSLQQSAEPSRRLLVATSRHVAATYLCTAKVRRVC